MTTIDFYFDFMSPYAYLAHHGLIDLAKRHSAQVVYHPIDLVQAKLAAGNTGPSNRDIPAKIRYLSKDLSRWAARYGVPLATPANHLSERVNIGAFYAIDRGDTQRYVEEVWHRTWGLGGDFTAPELLAEVSSVLDWKLRDVVAAIESDALRSRYAQSNLQAQAKGVFGVPTFMVGDEMWWGNDRLPFLDDYLRVQRA